MPLQNHLDSNKIFYAIKKEKDVDGLSPENVFDLFKGISGILTGNIESLSTMQTILGGIAIVAGTFYATMQGIAAVQGVITTLKATENNLSLKGIAIAIREKAVKYGGAVIDVISGAWKSFGAIPIIGAVLAAAAAAAGIAYLATSSKQGDDVMSPGSNSSGYGNRTLMGPEGAIQLNDKDTVIAGTNLFGNDIKSEPGKATQMGGKGEIKLGGDSSSVVNAIMELRKDVNALANRPISVAIDGKKVIEATTGAQPNTQGDENRKNSYKMS
jgi:hypothetical protein